MLGTFASKARQLMPLYQSLLGLARSASFKMQGFKRAPLIHQTVPLENPAIGYGAVGSSSIVLFGYATGCESRNKLASYRTSWDTMFFFFFRTISSFIPPSHPSSRLAGNRREISRRILQATGASRPGEGGQKTS